MGLNLPSSKVHKIWRAFVIQGHFLCHFTLLLLLCSKVSTKCLAKQHWEFSFLFKQNRRSLASEVVMVIFWTIISTCLELSYIRSLLFAPFFSALLLIASLWNRQFTGNHVRGCFANLSEWWRCLGTYVFNKPRSYASLSRFT